MLIRAWDEPIDDVEWRDFVRATGFGHLVAAGRDRDVPVVVPTQFVFDAVDPAEHGAQLRSIRGLRIAVEDVRAKFKYGANVDADHRRAVHDRLLARDGPGDRAAASHLEPRLGT